MDEQEIRFTASGGRRVAWARSGAGPPLVLAGWWMSHLELNWRDRRFRDFAHELGRHRTVIRYDAPGTGLSDDGVAPIATVEGEAAVLAAVIEAADASPVDLFAGSSGAPIGVALAATRPELVDRLVVYGGYASGAAIADTRTRQAMVGLVRNHWSLGSRMLADVFMPGADGSERDAFVAFQREAASAEHAARALDAIYDLDATELAGEVAAPVVVLHRRDDRAIPFRLGRDLAARMPRSRMVALDGADHFPWTGDADAVLLAVGNALGIAPTAPGARAQQAAAADAADVDLGVAADDVELTRREAEVLALVAGGLSDREIAERLVLSPHTVHRHVANIRAKLGLPTRAAAVAAAAKRGLL